MIRKRFIAEGYLFLTGYRSLVKFYAHKFDIKGYIQYQPDESMEIACEGTDKNIAFFKKAIKIRDDISYPMGFYVQSLRQRKAQSDETLGPFEIRHHRGMNAFETEMDKMWDAKMLIISWSAHKDAERAKAEKKLKLNRNRQ